MPNRIIKESICTSPDINDLSWFEEVLFYRLIVSCDDFGRYEGNPAVIKGRLFALKNVTIAQIETALTTLESKEMALRYEIDGRSYLYLPGWDSHQQKRAKHSKFPEPNKDSILAGASKCNQLHANVPENRETRSEKRETRNEKRYKGDTPQKFIPPTVAEVSAYCLERNNSIDPERFVSFYESKGWMVGKNKMKDWKAAVRSWERNEQTFTAKQKPQQPTARDILLGIKPGGSEVIDI